MATVTRGKIVRSDLANWDGATPTATRPDATGGTITGLAIGNEVDVLQVFGGGTSRTDGTLSNAVQKMGSAVATLVLAPGNWTIAANVTIPQNLSVSIPCGCVVSVDSGKTLTVNGDLIAGLYTVFSGSGSVVLNRVKGFRPQWWGAKADGSTNDATAINKAIICANASGGGSVLFAGGNYYHSSTLNGAVGVSYLGAGSLSTTLTADNCNGLTLDFQVAFGSIVVSGLNLQGTNGTTRYGIIAPGTTSSTDELYGLTIRDVLIRGFDVGIHFRTVRNFTIENCWIQDVTRAIELIGKNLVGYISQVKCTYGAGNGSGTKTGLLINSYTYAVGGTVPPEGIKINHCQWYGFNYGIDATFCNSLEITEFDIQALIIGAQWTTVQDGFTLGGGFINMFGAAATQGVKGQGLASEVDSNIKIKDVHVLCTSTVACAGFQVHDIGNTNQYNVHIDGGSSGGATTYDILFYNPGHSSIRNFRALSSGVIKSIYIDTVQSGHVFVKGCRCAGNVQTQPADAVAGKVRTYNNIVGGTNRSSTDAQDFYEEGSWTPADASGASLVFTSVDATYTRIGNMIFARFALTYPSTVNGSNNLIGGLPYTVKNSEGSRQGVLTYTSVSAVSKVIATQGAATFTIRTPAGVLATNTQLSTAVLYGTLQYPIS